MIAKLVDTPDTRKWYRYMYVGFVLNWFGHETVNLGGADFDYDIVASTNDPNVIGGVYRDELTVAYDAPKPAKTSLTEEGLYEADRFSFGSQIGPVTNKGSSGYALLALLEARFGPANVRCDIIRSRLKQCCVAQSRCIDKAKIGKPVKGIPKIWTEVQRIADSDELDAATTKEVMNDCLLNRRPYFFKYRYPETANAYDKHRKMMDNLCRLTFRMKLEELLALPAPTEEQEVMIARYYDTSPLIESDSTMNLLCYHIESLQLDLQSKFRAAKDGFDGSIYLDGDVGDWEAVYDEVVKTYNRYMCKYGYLTQMFPVDNLCWYKEYDSEDLDMVEAAYAMENDTLTILSITHVKLVASIRDVAGIIAAKDAEIAQLKPKAEAYDAAEAAKAKAQHEADVASLMETASCTGLFTAEEMTDMASVFEAVDEATVLRKIGEKHGGSNGGG